MKKPSLEDRIATSNNLRHITTTQEPYTATTRTGKVVTLAGYDKRHLAEQRALLAQLELLDTTPLDTTVHSWQELKEAGIDMFDDFTSATIPTLGDSQARSILHAGTAGIGSIGAFLEVIPQLQNPDHTPANIARQSLRTLMWWSALSEKADAGISQTIATSDTRNSLPVREKYINLTYDPQFFSVSDTGTLHLDLDLLRPHEANIDRGLRGNDIYYGCPFRRSLPKVYGAMLQTAIRSNLLAE